MYCELFPRELFPLRSFSIVVFIMTNPFKVVEAEGGRLVKEADFEAEKFFLLKQKI